MTSTVLKGIVVSGALLVCGCADGPSRAPGFPQNLAGHAVRWDKVGVVYCSNARHAPSKTFAGRIEPDGSLTFGLSIWAGNNIVLFGKAIPDGQGWQYTEPPDEDLPNLKCKVKIIRDSLGAPTVIGDPEANCLGLGGAGMTIGNEKFRKRDYEGPVTFELNDEETFWKGDGKC